MDIEPLCNSEGYIILGEWIRFDRKQKEHEHK